MRPLIVTCSLLLSSLAFADVTVGAAPPGFTLTDISGKKVSLSDYAGKTVVLEWFNPNCPFVNRHTKDKTMSTTAQKHPNAVWLGINSTSKAHQDFMRPEQLQKWATDNGITYPLLIDADGEVGKKYGAKTTPHMFVIGADGKVAYAGAIDDDPSGRSKPSERKNYVDQALKTLEQGGKVQDAATKSYGCGVKYSS